MKDRFTDIINRGIESYLENVYTCLPGKIESYDRTMKKAKVKPLIKKSISGTTLSYPVINEVPVIMPCTANAIIHLPVKKGDGCLIFFSRESLENYLNSRLNEVEPGDKRRFSLSDAFCLPGLFPFGNPGKTVTNGNDIIIDNSGNVTIKGTFIDLNGNSKSLVTHTELNLALQSYNTQLAVFFTALYALLGTPYPGATIDISAAKTTTIRTGG